MTPVVLLQTSSDTDESSLENAENTLQTRYLPWFILRLSLPSWGSLRMNHVINLYNIFYWTGIRLFQIHYIFFDNMRILCLNYNTCWKKRTQTFSELKVPTVLKEDSCLIYAVCVCLRIVFSNIYCVVFFVFFVFVLYLVYQMLSVSLYCPFFIFLRFLYTYTFWLSIFSKCTDCSIN